MLSWLYFFFLAPYFFCLTTLSVWCLLEDWLSPSSLGSPPLPTPRRGCDFFLEKILGRNQGVNFKSDESTSSWIWGREGESERKGERVYVGRSWAQTRTLILSRTHTFFSLWGHLLRKGHGRWWSGLSAVQRGYLLNFFPPILLKRSAAVSGPWLDSKVRIRKKMRETGWHLDNRCFQVEPDFSFLSRTASILKSDSFWEMFWKTQLLCHVISTKLVFWEQMCVGVISLVRWAWCDGCLGTGQEGRLSHHLLTPASLHIVVPQAATRGWCLG